MANRRASITDLAKALNLSTSTISRALADHNDVSEATKKRVRELAEELSYQPNQLAAALRRGRSNTLGVLVPHITGNFFPQVVNGIALEASKAGFNVMICQSNEDVKQERKNIDLLMNSQVEGILVSVSNTTQDFGHFDAVRSQDVPLVFFDRIVEGFRGNNVSAVMLDDYQGAYQLVSHLIEQGCTRIAHFTGPLHINIHKNRHQGYRDALTAHGLEIDEDLISVMELNQKTGTAAMKRMLKQSNVPDAVFASNDLAAVGAMQAAKAQGLRVPQDMAIAGFSNEVFTSLTEPTITTVDQGCETMGISAVRLLQKMLNGNPDRQAQPRNVVLRPKLLVRESSLRKPE
ncbi:LacI family DNA-binding transcriptional regulator [Hymenobacter sp. ASUV-10]|uniref:LacI family DNA-binding transcriptional regulator n=1 Tax=Hymenobacter aranciens TaxID=3063996 RepID=A0ABT9B959_9BACT|nr:LacI family DNA-binding transcriptional regulator [Hymenobacter sp. ASUV-10]MDO7874807.1 LacI family DNA-binding transcriptional regulator [Hymenobacter sp. ASUV-10]